MQQIAASVGDTSSLECLNALKSNPNTYLIDVRTPEEWQETGVADLSSVNKDVKLITWTFFTPYIHANSNFIDQLDSAVSNKQADLFFICKSGGRSLKAATAAMQAGYSKCHNVSDGFAGNMFDSELNSLNLNGWTNNNLPRRKL